MSEIVVTGAAGFVAGHVRRRLEESGHKVVPVTRQKLPGMFQVNDYIDCPDADLLMHFAEEPDRAKVNSIGEKYVNDSASVVEHLASRFGKRMIYASSGTVYGDKINVPFTVKSKTYVTDTYSKSKLQNEKIVLEFGGTVLRLANIYGNGMSGNNVLSDIIKQLNVDGPMIIRNDSPSRDFVSVTDVAELLNILAGKSYCGILNVGSGVGISIKRLAKMILEIAGQGGREIVSQETNNHFSNCVLDISATKYILGWAPSASLKKQLNTMLEKGENVINEKT